MTPAERQARRLIGQPGSRYAIPTPALVLDEDALDDNIGRMAARARQAGLALRPHAKTHKSAWIVRKQMTQGAVGFCCAKLGEAEALVAAGCRGALLTSPIHGTDTVERLFDVAEQDPGLMAVVDHPLAVRDLADEAKRRARRLNLVLDVDVGLGRTGVRDAEAALELARAVPWRHTGVWALSQCSPGTRRRAGLPPTSRRSSAVGDCGASGRPAPAPRALGCSEQ